MTVFTLLQSTLLSEALDKLSKLLQFRRPFWPKKSIWPRLYHQMELLFVKYYLILSYLTSILNCIYVVSGHFVSKVIDSPVRKLYSGSLWCHYLCIFSYFLYFSLNWIKLAPISWLWACDLELLFGDLTNPCRGPSLRNESSLEHFIRESTRFQLKKSVLEKISSRISKPEKPKIWQYICWKSTSFGKSEM